MYASLFSLGQKRANLPRRRFWQTERLPVMRLARSLSGVGALGGAGKHRANIRRHRDLRATVNVIGRAFGRH